MIKFIPVHFLSYVIMTICFMGTCSIFHGEVNSMRWLFFYYGSFMLLFVLSLYSILFTKKTNYRELLFFVALFCGPKILMFIYSCILWIINNTPFPYISRGISDTLFGCIAFFCGISLGFRLKQNIINITLMSALTVYATSYLIGFLDNGINFIYAFNPLNSLADNYTNYTELHQLTYIVGLYLIVCLLKVNDNNLHIDKTVLLLSVFTFFVSWKRIGIVAILFTMAYLYCSNIIIKKYKSIFLKSTGIVGIIACMLFVYTVISGTFIDIMDSFSINLMGRNIIYSYFSQFANFSYSFIGNGLGFVGRTFDYTTRDDLYNMVSIKALHNDFFKMYLEIGFLCFLLWLIWWLLKLPCIIKNRYGIENAQNAFLLILYSYILYSTDNAEGYTYFQVHFAALIVLLSKYSSLRNNRDKFRYI